MLGYHEITLKSNTEPAVNVFRSRVADLCREEVATEDAVKGDEPSNGLIENTVMPMRGTIITIKCHVESGTQEELREDLADPTVVGGTRSQHPHPGVRQVATNKRQLKNCTARTCHKDSSPLVRKCWQGNSQQHP